MIKSNEDSQCLIYMCPEPYYIEKLNLNVFFMEAKKDYSLKNNTLTANSDLNDEILTQIITIFTLSNLMSSVLIMNLSGGITDSSLKQLAQVTYLNENVSLITEDKDSEYKNDYLPYYMPYIMFLFRDYISTENELDSDVFNKSQKMQSFLNQPHNNTKVSKHIKNCIIDMYKDLDCWMLEKPEFNSNGGPKWQSSIKKLKERILEKVKCKELYGIKLNCRMFCSIVHSFIEEINENCVMNINNAFEYMMENECIMGFNEGVDEYNEGIKAHFNNDEVKSMVFFVNTLKVKTKNFFLIYQLSRKSKIKH